MPAHKRLVDAYLPKPDWLAERSDVKHPGPRGDRPTKLARSAPHLAIHIGGAAAAALANGRAVVRPERSYVRSSRRLGPAAASSFGAVRETRSRTGVIATNAEYPFELERSCARAVPVDTSR
jgi:hypothetical protein